MNLYALYGLNFLFQVSSLWFQVYCLKLNLFLKSCNTKSHEVLHRVAQSFFNVLSLESFTETFHFV